jgi:hypothetical protein
MRIPARFAPIVFGARLSAIMVAIVSAFPTVTLIAPWVRRAVGRLTA